jgi:hypothetical protein
MRTRFIYWAHTNNKQPSRVFKTKRDAIKWAREVYFGTFIVEPIAIGKHNERIQYIRESLSYDVITA